MKGIVAVAALVLVAALVIIFMNSSEPEEDVAPAAVATSTKATEKLVQPKKLPMPDPKASKSIFDPSRNQPEKKEPGKKD